MWWHSYGSVFYTLSSKCMWGYAVHNVLFIGINLETKYGYWCIYIFLSGRDLGSCLLASQTISPSSSALSTHWLGATLQGFSLESFSQALLGPLGTEFATICMQCMCSVNWVTTLPCPDFSWESGWQPFVSPSSCVCPFFITKGLTWYQFRLGAETRMFWKFEFCFCYIFSRGQGGGGRNACCVCIEQKKKNPLWTLCQRKAAILNLSKQQVTCWVWC